MPEPGSSGALAARHYSVPETVKLLDKIRSTRQRRECTTTLLELRDEELQQFMAAAHDKLGSEPHHRYLNPRNMLIVKFVTAVVAITLASALGPFTSFLSLIGLSVGVVMLAASVIDAKNMREESALNKGKIKELLDMGMLLKSQQSAKAASHNMEPPLQYHHLQPQSHSPDASFASQVPTDSGRSYDGSGQFTGVPEQVVREAKATPVVTKKRWWHSGK